MLGIPHCLLGVISWRWAIADVGFTTLYIGSYKLALDDNRCWVSHTVYWGSTIYFNMEDGIILDCLLRLMNLEH